MAESRGPPSMACVTCPYLENYELLWQDLQTPPRICVKLWCCAGPELQVRDGSTVVVDEYFTDVADLYARAEMLRQQRLPMPASEREPSSALKPEVS